MVVQNKNLNIYLQLLRITGNVPDIIENRFHHAVRITSNFKPEASLVGDLTVTDTPSDLTENDSGAGSLGQPQL